MFRGIWVLAVLNDRLNLFLAQSHLSVDWYVAVAQEARGGSGS